MKSLVHGERQYPHLARLAARREAIDRPSLDVFVQLLAGCRHPVFVVGDGAAADAASAIAELATRLGAPLVTTPQGKGLVNPHHPLYRGVIGFAGHASAVDSLRDPRVDLVVVIGSSLGEWASNGWDRQAILNGKLVHISCHDSHFHDSPMARLHLRGDIAGIFAEVLCRLDTSVAPGRAQASLPARTAGSGEYPFSLDDPAACQDDSRPILPQRLMTELPRLFPPDTHYFADSGNSLAWAVHYLHPASPQSWGEGQGGSLFHGSFEFASMGWAIACSVGAALALGERTPVVCITGDGSYLMSSQEITVAIQQQLPVIYLIINDGCYGMVKHGQRLTGAEPIGFELPPVDYAAMARAMGVESYTVDSVAALRKLDVQSICQRRGPTLLDVRIDAEARPPIGLRTRILKGES